MSVLASLSDGAPRVVPLGDARTVADLVGVLREALGLPLPAEAYGVLVAGDGGEEDVAGQGACGLAEVGIYGGEERVAVRVRGMYAAREQLREEGLTSEEDVAEALFEAVRAGAVERVRVVAGAGRVALGRYLRDAVRRGMFEVTKALLEAGGGAVGEAELSALLRMACEEGHVGTAEVLLERGADINAEYVDGVGGVLHVACDAGHVEVVRLLVGRGADVNAKKGLLDATPLFFACANGRTDVVAFLLGEGADVRSKLVYGHTALHGAGRVGNVEIARLLLDGGADVNAIEVESGWTPLHGPCHAGAREFVACLVAGGADVNVRETVNDCAPLHYACGEGHVEVAGVLLDAGADVNARRRGGNTALHAACAAGHVGVVRLLRARGADVDARNDGGQTALAMACCEGRRDVVALLCGGGVPHNKGGAPLG